MTTASMATDNPFVDPTSFEDGRGSLAADTLALGRSISLTLGTDALIVLGEPRTVAFSLDAADSQLQTKSLRRGTEAIVAAFGQVC